MSSLTQPHPQEDAGFRGRNLALTTAAIAAGVLAGWWARNVPLWIAIRLARPASLAGCGMEEVLSCALENVPAFFTGLVKLAVVLIAVCLVWTAAGVACAVVGLVLRPTATQREAVRAMLLFAAAALLLPPLRWGLALLVEVLRA